MGLERGSGGLENHYFGWGEVRSYPGFAIAPSHLQQISDHLIWLIQAPNRSSKFINSGSSFIGLIVCGAYANAPIAYERE